jgi:hypothetical protein
MSEQLYSRDGRSRGRWAVLAVFFLDLRAHFLEALAFVRHLHHVTRDAYADVSGEAHAIEDRLFRRRAVFEITRGIARMAFRAAAAVTGDILESIPIRDREAIRFPNFHGRLGDVGRQNIFRSQLVTVFRSLESSAAAGRHCSEEKQSIGQKISSMHPYLDYKAEVVGCDLRDRSSEKDSLSTVKALFRNNAAMAAPTRMSGQAVSNIATPAAATNTARLAMMSLREHSHVERMLRSSDR